MLSFDDSANHLVDQLMNFIKTNRRDRIEMRNRVESTSDQFDWNVLVENYWKAHDLSLSFFERLQKGGSAKAE